MLSHAKEHESLTGKLLLSTALVAVTVGYGWWQHNQMSQQQAAAMAAMQMQAAPTRAPAQAQHQAMAAAPQTATSATNAAAQSGSPVESAANAPAAQGSSNAAATAKSTQLAMAAPSQNGAPAAFAAQAAAPAQTVLLPATPPPPLPPMALTGMDAIRAFIPTEGISPPLPPVTGTPDPGAAPPIPAGTHLEDGDYESDKVMFEWGNIRARIVVTGGKITTVQIMSYPDHRSQSLYLIQLADPILTSEVIKSQASEVNVVSSATNTSIAFQDAIASAIIKATR
ncbi:MAG TPA: FMN-binding protein [Rhizomicrobium sp.]|nr:FMN-binding protein [Rhizomicrobium sp.]